MTLADRIAELIEQHGSLRAAARVLECDAGYLSRLQSGEKDSPEDWLLRRMNLRRVVSYERIAHPALGKSLLRPAIGGPATHGVEASQEGQP